MAAILRFCFHFGILLSVWWLTTRHDRRDFVFLVFGLIFATSICNFFGTVWMVRMRHLILPLAVVAVYLRRTLLKGNLGSLAVIYLLLTVTIFAASLWSSDPLAFMALKWRRVANNVCVILMAGTFRTGDDLKKFLYAALPQIVLLSIGLTSGTQDFASFEDERLVVNEVNSNGVGAMGGFAVLVALSALLYLKMKIWWKVLLTGCLLLGFKALVGSGSRTAFASCMGGAFVLMSVLFTRMRLFWTAGIPILLMSGLGVYYVWSRAAHSVVDRLSGLATGGVSGRDLIWESGFRYLMDNGLWLGTGGLEQGFFVARADLVSVELRWGSMLNIYFDAIYETGLIGLCLWILFIAVFVWLVIRIWRKGTAPLRYVPMALCVFGLLQGVGESMPSNACHPIGTLMVVGMVVLSARCFRYEAPRACWHQYRAGGRSW